MRAKLCDFYKSLKIQEQKTELTVTPFVFDTVCDAHGVQKAKGHDGKLYNVHSVAAFYSVALANDKKYRIFAFIGKPKTPKPKGGYPAIVLAHGGGGISYFEWVEHWVSRGYVAIAPDLGGHYAKNGLERRIPNPDGTPEGEVERMGSFFQTEDIANSWMYFGTVALGCAINALHEYAEIDSERVALAGISWGGVLSLHAAGAEHRFKAVSIIYSSAYVSDTNWAMDGHNVKSLTEEQLAIYREYLDPCNSISFITQPILFTAGMDDPAFTMLNRAATANEIKTEKTFAFKTQFPHGHWEGWTPLEAYEFTDSVFGLRNSLPYISLKKTDRQVEVLIQDGKKIDKIYVCYTTENLDRMVNQSFEERMIERVDNKYIFKLPSCATAYFVRYVTGNGVSFSTNIEIL